MKKYNVGVKQEISERLPDYVRVYLRASDKIAETILDLMDRKELSDNELAKKLKESPTQVRNYLSGEYDFTLKELAKLEQVLGEKIVPFL